MADALTALLSSDATRWVIAAEMLLLVSTTVFLRMVDDAPVSPIRVMDGWLLSVLGVVAAGVLANIASGVDLTPAAYVVALGVAPATVRGLTLAGGILRATHTHRSRRWAIIFHSRDVAAWLDRMDDLDPCPDPGCTRARAEIRELVNR